MSLPLLVDFGEASFCSREYSIRLLAGSGCE
jgi:hypothetical protein